MDPTNGIGRIGTVQWSFAKQKISTSWASPSVAKKRTLKLPVPSQTVNLSMETYGSVWKLCGSWVLECAQCPQSCQRTPSQIMAGDYEILCVDVSRKITTLAQPILWFYAFRESAKGGGLSRWVCWGFRWLNVVSSISLSVPLFVVSSRLFFSSPFTIVRIVRVTTNICESCHSDTVPSNSAMFFCCAWTAWSGASLLCESGFSWLPSGELT